MINRLKEFFKSSKYSIKYAYESAKFAFIAYLLLQLVISFFPLITVFIWKILFEEIINHSTTNISDKMWILVIIYIIVQVINSQFINLSSFLVTIMKGKIQCNIDVGIMSKCSDIDVSKYDDPSNLDKINSVKYYSWCIVSSSFDYVIIINQAIIFISSILVLFSYNLLISMLFLVSVIPGSIITYKNMSKMRNFNINSIAEFREK